MKVDFNAVNKTNAQPPAQPARAETEIVEERSTTQAMPATLADFKAELFDLDKVKAGLAPIYGKLDELADEAKGLVIDSDEAQEKAVETLGLVKKTLNSVEKQRKDIVDEPGSFVRSVNSLAKGLKDKLTAVESTVKIKAAKWAQLQEQKRQEEERKAAEEARKLEEEHRRKAEAEQRRLAEEQRKIEEAKSKADAEERERLEAEQRKLDEQKQAAKEAEAISVQAPALPKKETVVRTAHGAAHTRKVWKFEVESTDEIPREYLMADEKKIRAAVKNGVRNIPGVKIFQNTEMTIRS